MPWTSPSKTHHHTSKCAQFLGSLYTSTREMNKIATVYARRLTDVCQGSWTTYKAKAWELSLHDDINWCASYLNHFYCDNLWENNNAITFIVIYKIFSAWHEWACDGLAIFPGYFHVYDAGLRHPHNPQAVWKLYEWMSWLELQRPLLMKHNLQGSSFLLHHIKVCTSLKMSYKI